MSNVELLQKLLNVCSGCIYFEISDNGVFEEYRCNNDDRWLSLGYTDEELEEDYEDNIRLIALAKYDSRGLVEFYVEDLYFDFDGCKYKKLKKG